MESDSGVCWVVPPWNVLRSVDDIFNCISPILVVYSTIFNFYAYGDILFQAKTSASEKVKPEDLYEDDLAVEIEDEYDPAIPNSYEQVVKERRLERDRIREEEVSES